MIPCHTAVNSASSKRWVGTLLLALLYWGVPRQNDCRAQHELMPYVEFTARKVASATQTPDDKVMVVGGGIKDKDGTIGKGYIKLADPENNKEFKFLTGHKFPVFSVAITPDGKVVVSGSASPQPKLQGELKVWDAATGKATDLPWIYGAIYALNLSTDGKLLAVAGFGGRICVFDMTTGKEVADGLHRATISRLTFTRDSKRLASSDVNGTVKLWDPRTMEELTTFKHSNGGFALAFTPDGKTLATGGRGNVLLWDVETGKELRTLTGYAGVVTSLCFSPDSMILAVGTSGLRYGGKDGPQPGDVKLWDRTAGKEVQTVKMSAGPVIAVTFTREGKGFRVVDDEGMAKDWNFTAK